MITTIMNKEKRKRKRENLFFTPHSSLIVCSYFYSLLIHPVNRYAYVKA